MASTFLEPEGEEMTISFEVTPVADWLSLDYTDASNYAFVGTPTNSDEAAYTVTIKAADPHAFNAPTLDEIKIIVEANQSPTISVPLPSSLSATVAVLFEYTIPDGTFTDPEGDNFSLSISGVDWLSISSNTIKGTPPDNSAAGDYTVTVTADDIWNDNASGSTSFVLAVALN